jgi:hypothetical protein
MSDFVRMAGSCKDQAVLQAVGGEMRDDCVFLPANYFCNLANDPGWVVIVGELQRPGVRLLSTKIEYKYFPPTSADMNAVFNFGVLQWKACFDFPYVVMAFPSFVFDASVELAKECDLQFVNGVPVMLGFKEAFPINGKNIFKIESLPGSKIYAGALSSEGGFSGYQQRINEMLTREDKDIEAFIAACEVKPN